MIIETYTIIVDSPYHKHPEAVQIESAHNVHDAVNKARIDTFSNWPGIEDIEHIDILAAITTTTGFTR